MSDMDTAAELQSPDNEIDNGNDLLENAESESHLDLYKEFIALAKRAEDKKSEILKEEESLCQILRTKHNEEANALNNTKELLNTKEQLRNKFNRLNDSNETICEQMNTIKSLEIEVSELATINKEVKSTIAKFSAKVGEKQGRLQSLIPKIAGSSVECQTDLAGSSASKVLLGNLYSFVNVKLAEVEVKVNSLSEELGLHPVETLRDLIAEEKELKRQIRELKSRLKLETPIVKGVKRASTSTSTARNRKRSAK